jgi:hypothetical protein
VSGISLRRRSLMRLVVRLIFGMDAFGTWEQTVLDGNCRNGKADSRRVTTLFMVSIHSKAIYTFTRSNLRGQYPQLRFSFFPLISHLFPDDEPPHQDLSEPTTPAHCSPVYASQKDPPLWTPHHQPYSLRGSDMAGVS